MTPFPPALATLSWGLGEVQSTQFCLGLNLSDWCLMRRGIIHLVQAGIGIKHLHPGSQKIVVLPCFTTEYKWIQEKHSYMGPEGACNQVSWSLDEIAAFALAQYVQLATVWWKLFWNQNGITNQRKLMSPLYLASIKHVISYVTFSQGWTPLLKYFHMHIGSNISDILFRVSLLNCSPISRKLPFYGHDMTWHVTQHLLWRYIFI